MIIKEVKSQKLDLIAFWEHGGALLAMSGGGISYQFNGAKTALEKCSAQCKTMLIESEGSKNITLVKQQDGVRPLLQDQEQFFVHDQQLCYINHFFLHRFTSGYWTAQAIATAIPSDAPRCYADGFVFAMLGKRLQKISLTSGEVNTFPLGVEVNKQAAAVVFDRKILVFGGITGSSGLSRQFVVFDAASFRVLSTYVSSVVPCMHSAHFVAHGEDLLLVAGRDRKQQLFGIWKILLLDDPVFSEE